MHYNVIKASRGGGIRKCFLHDAFAKGELQKNKDLLIVNKREADFDDRRETFLSQACGHRRRQVAAPDPREQGWSSLPSTVF